MKSGFYPAASTTIRSTRRTPPSRKRRPPSPSSGSMRASPASAVSPPSSNARSPSPNSPSSATRVARGSPIPTTIFSSVSRRFRMSKTFPPSRRAFSSVSATSSAAQKYSRNFASNSTTISPMVQKENRQRTQPRRSLKRTSPTLPTFPKTFLKTGWEISASAKQRNSFRSTHFSMLRSSPTLHPRRIRPQAFFAPSANLMVRFVASTCFQEPAVFPRVSPKRGSTACSLQRSFRPTRRPMNSTIAGHK